jgi:hypothetical protein
MYVDQLDAAAHGQPAPSTVNVVGIAVNLDFFSSLIPLPVLLPKSHVIVQKHPPRPGLSNAAVVS